MGSSRTSLVHHAVVLAAGNGDRFQNGFSHSKLLTPIAGTPLLIRTLMSARAAGITDTHVILGYDAESVRSIADEHAPDGLSLHFHINDNWQLENGLSVLAARPLTNEPFALMMGDHVFEDGVLRQLLRSPLRPDEALLCVDQHSSDPDLVEEATKVRMRGGRVTAIGKDVDPYDALDTGLFLCQSSIFDALEESCLTGDSTLSGGIRRLAARGLVRGVDIGRARWCDIDTVSDLAMAEQILALTPAE